MECVVGQGARNSEGYHTRRVNGEMMLVHRAAWLEVNGPIPEEMHLHHICGNRRCVRVEHLMLVTPAEHRQLHRLTTCPRCGSSERKTTTRGDTYCVPCQREYWRTKSRQRRAACKK